MIGIIGAMDAEVDLLIAELDPVETVHVVGLEMHLGTLSGYEVAVAVGGVGTANAAAATAAMLATVTPDRVVCLGVAGGLEPALLGDVVIGSGLISYGFGQLRAEGFVATPTEPPRADGRSNPLVFPADPALLAAARRASAGLTLVPLDCAGDDRAPAFHVGVIATEDAYSIDERRNRGMQADHGCIAFEMEGAAIAQICHQNGVPFLAIRAISNPATEAADRDGVYRRCKHETARCAQQVVLALLEQLSVDDEPGPLAS